MTPAAAEIITIIDNLARTDIPERPDNRWAAAFVELAETIAAIRASISEHQFRALIAVGELMLPLAVAEANAMNEAAEGIREGVTWQ